MQLCIFAWKSLHLNVDLKYLNLPFVHGLYFVYYKSHPPSPREIDNEVKGGIDNQEEMVETSDA